MTIRFILEQPISERTLQACRAFVLASRFGPETLVGFDKKGGFRHSTPKAQQMRKTLVGVTHSNRTFVLILNVFKIGTHVVLRCKLFGDLPAAFCHQSGV